MSAVVGVTYEFRFYRYPPGPMETVRVRADDMRSAERLARRIVFKRLGLHVLTELWEPGVVIESPDE